VVVAEVAVMGETKAGITAEVMVPTAMVRVVMLATIVENWPLGS
jgi:hypothetical protein